MLYVPRHLPNKLEYKVLSCISVHYQSRMASNGIAITLSHPPTVQAGQYGESFYTSRSSPGTVLGDVVDAAAWGSKIYTLRGGWMVAGKGVRCMQWWCCVFVFGHWQSLANRSMRIQDLYVGAVPIPQFIKKKSHG